MPTQSAPAFGTMTTDKALPSKAPKSKQIHITVTHGPNSAQDLAHAIAKLCMQWQDKRNESLDARVIGDALRLAGPITANLFKHNVSAG